MKIMEKKRIEQKNAASATKTLVSNNDCLFILLALLACLILIALQVNPFLAVGISVTIFLFGCDYTNSHAQHKSKTEIVIATIDGKTLLYKSEGPMEHIVFMTFKDHKIAIKDDSLYNLYEVGEMIKLNMVSSYSYHGKWVCYYTPQGKLIFRTLEDSPY